MRQPPKMLARLLRGLGGRGKGNIRTEPTRALLEDRGPSVREVLDAVHQKALQRPPGPRTGWEADAAIWVKKTHVDRGAFHVARPTKAGVYKVDDNLRPRFIVPDLDATDLRPYVQNYDEGDVIELQQKKK